MHVLGLAVSTRKKRRKDHSIHPGQSISHLGFLSYYVLPQPPIFSVQPADIGLPTGNGKKLRCSHAQLGQATGLAVAYFLSISGGPSYVRRLYRCFRRLPNSRTADFFRILTAVHTNIMDLREFINVSKRVEVHSFESEENHDNEEKMEVRQQKAF